MYELPEDVKRTLKLSGKLWESNDAPGASEGIVIIPTRVSVKSITESVERYTPSRTENDDA